MRLSVLALLQGLLCLTASSRAFRIPDEDRDYELVKEIAHKYYKEQRAEANRKGQEEEDMAPVVVLLAPNTDGEDPGNIKGQEEIPNDPIMIYLDIPGAMSEDGQDEQEEREQDLAREIEINETIDQVSAMNEQLFMMSVLAHRLSELFEKEMVQGESDVDVPGEEQNQGDLKKTEDLVKEDKQPTAKMAGNANGWGLSKKENMADSENTHVNDLPSVIPKAKETGSSKAENKNPRKKRSSGDRIYFPGEDRQQEDEFGQEEEDEASFAEEFIEPASRPRHDFDPDAAIFELEAEIVENGVGEGEGPRHPPPDLSNDLNVNFPPRDSEFALEINPDAEIIDPELVAAEERLFRSGRRDK
ncbi:uncharacterized protein LOC143018234 isoform X1 [Oratosquilla oratoria]|uniref:uncharacterized protein LOC143018234 isoform X1 n=1 Tax=Oratosquilla oratoria TaxID=337810 RepID=UPI003F772193